MQLLSQIKKDIEFNQGLYGLIDVLKSIAIAQYRSLENRIKQFEKFFIVLGSFFAMIDADKSDHPLINTQGRRMAIIAVTSDSGLVGGLNTRVMNLALKEVRNNQAKLIVVGERGKAYVQDSGVDLTAFGGINDDTRLSQAEELRDYVLAQELKREIGALKIIYPYPLSIVLQAVGILQLLPFSQTIMDKYQSRPEQLFGPASGFALSPEHKKASPAGFDPSLKEAKVSSSRLVSELIMESSPSDIAGYLAYLFLGHKFGELFGLSRLAELSARFAHLEDSKTKVEQLNKQLKMQYFRQRHEMIDRNMREIFASRINLDK